MIIKKGFPEGEVGSYILREYLSPKVQVSTLHKLLDISMQFAKELYSNGVIVNDAWITNPDEYMKFLYERQKRIPNYNAFAWGNIFNAVLIDTWFRRGVTWPVGSQIIHYHESRSEKSTTPMGSPFTDRERWTLQRIRTALLKIVPEKIPHLDYEIPIWRVHNKEELFDITDKISALLRDAPEGPHVPWYRGLTREYFTQRSTMVNSWLKYPLSTATTISLLPNLARITKTNSELQETKWIFKGGEYIDLWLKPFMIWIFKQNPSWFRCKTDLLSQFDEALEDPTFENIAKILLEIQLNPHLFDEADDARSYILNEYKHSSMVLILQHYGMPTSGLDITKNIDTALFFALNKFDINNNSYVELNNDSHQSPVIYIFSESLRYGIDNSALPAQKYFESGEPEPPPIPLRIARQECGLLYGSNIYGWNVYADLIIGKIVLENFEDKSDRSSSYLFPGSSEDRLYDLLLRTKPALPYLIKYNH